MFKATTIAVPLPPLISPEKVATALAVPTAGSAIPNTVTMLSSVPSVPAVRNLLIAEPPKVALSVVLWLLVLRVPTNKRTYLSSPAVATATEIEVPDVTAAVADPVT